MHDILSWVPARAPALPGPPARRSYHPARRASCPVPPADYPPPTGKQHASVTARTTSDAGQRHSPRRAHLPDKVWSFARTNARRQTRRLVVWSLLADTCSGGGQGFGERSGAREERGLAASLSFCCWCWCAEMGALRPQRLVPKVYCAPRGLKDTEGRGTKVPCCAPFC